MRGPAYFSAGISPKSSPDSSEIASVNPSARPSRAISFRRGSVAGPALDQDAQAGARERQPEHAAGAPEQRALDQQPADDPSAAGAERGTHRQLLLPAFGAHEQQARDVGAGDEHHDADRSHQHPQRVRDVADDVLLERAQCRRDAPALVDARVDGRRGRPGRHPDRHHARDVGAGVRDRDARLQPRHGLQPEAGQRQAAAIDAKRHDEVGFDVDDAESFGHDADDLARARFDSDASSDDRRGRRRSGAASSRGRASRRAALPAPGRRATASARASAGRRAPAACRRTSAGCAPVPVRRCRSPSPSRQTRRRCARTSGCARRT